ncbi:hypothetical protein NOCD_12835 [Nocardioides cavernae]|uniref:hypothetical protein n=1 Tax=Nocardioides TaxID=1839 RepID=UPI0012E3E97E|nr:MULTISPECIES: hypothetical protein [Nocardioides]MCK9824364.1 hypothetical protein [Nocardioides cavernae]
MRTMLRTAAVSGVLALALTGCVPSEPSVADWRSSTSQALEDTASEVESVALVLYLQSHDRLPGRAARVAAVESEESLATAVEGVTTQQPPPGEAREDREVGELLSRASDLVREARIALTAGDESSYAELRNRLLDLSDDLDTAREGLR